ncbi:MAG: alpha-mannosidase, partial [Acidimicrobiia bacterium]
PDGPSQLRLIACHLAVVEEEVDALWHDWTLLCELYDALPSGEAQAAQILHGLDQAANVLSGGGVVERAGAARAVLRPLLERPASASAHTFAAVGNAHIDTAWLWPLRETERKVARTFATALDLMEDFPEYRFAASQAQQLAWVRDKYPELFEGIRKRVADGRFEVVGSMWVEADCNVPSGESLVRQITHGRRFYQEEFGVETRSLWLPDVFGYAAALPQILAQSGIRWFLTQKMSWNQVNRFPHHTFWWEGIDGTRVFTHFPPADTYNGDFSVAQLIHGARNFSEKATCDRSMYLFGFGDGGGGPTAEMLERARRVADLEGVPRVELTGAEQAFELLEADASSAGAPLPVWVGELYLEMHRGTYTTHAEVKRANRKLELALRDAELWSVAASDVAGSAYPAEELDAAWKTLLLHQFHDIIPGSSIRWVYEDTARDHAAVAEVTDRLIVAALSAVAGSGGSGEVLVANPLSRARREVIDIDGSAAFASAPACGWEVQPVLRDLPGDVAPVIVGERFMENGLLRVEWDEDGLLTSLVHLPSGREAVAPGERLNVLQVHDDRPNVYDAWDIDAVAYDTITELTGAESVEVVESTPMRGSVRVIRRLGASTIDQTMRLAAGSPRLEFHSVVDWQESHTLLKVAFPLDVHTHRASFEIQYGHVERPTHRNTSWDEARFEVCAHTWADLSEQGFGVALLNDCKYGHDVNGNVMRLTLLRSSTHPDPVADKGRHEFAYALFPHEGDAATGGVIAEAHAFNSPLRTVPAGTGAASTGARSVVQVEGDGVVVTAVKRADDGEGTIVRCYEAFG